MTHATATRSDVPITPESVSTAGDRAEIRRSPWWLLVALVALSLVLKGWLWWAARYALQPDSLGYLDNARLLSQGRWSDLNIVFPLGYSALLAGVIPAGGSLEVWGSWISIMLSAALVVPVLLLATSLFDRRVARISAALVLVDPLLNLHAPMVLSDATYVTLVAAGLAFGWDALVNPRAGWMALTGLVFGAAYLMREEGIGYGAIFLLMAGGVLRQRPPVQRLRLLGGYVLAWLAMVVPYVVFLHWRTGSWVLTSQMGNVAIDVASGQALAAARSQPGTAYRFIGEHLGAFLLKYARNVWEGFNSALPALLSPALLAIAALGVCHRPWTRRDAQRYGYLVVMSLLPLVITSVSHVLVRYLLAALPVLLILTAKGLEALQAWGEASLQLCRVRLARPLIGRPILAGVVVMLMAVGVLLAPFRPQLGLVPVYETEMREAGQWMRDHLPHPARVFTSTGGVEYYAQMERILIRVPGSRTVHETLPLEDILVLAARGSRPCYLVVQERWPQKTLLPLLDETQAPAGLRPVYMNTTYRGAKVIVYEIQSTRNAG